MSIELGLQLMHQSHAKELPAAPGLGGGVAACVEKAELSSLRNKDRDSVTKTRFPSVSSKTPPSLALTYIPKLKLASRETNDTHFDFIIRNPKSTFRIDRLRFMPQEEARSAIAQRINDFLKDVWDGIVKKAKKNAQPADHGTLNQDVNPPLTYREHQLRDDGSIAIALGLHDPGNNLTKELARFCDYVHSPECTKERHAKQLSEWGIFGLIPVKRTLFAFFWDMGFIYNMLQNGDETVQSALSWMKEMGKKLDRMDIEWLRVGGFLINYLLKGKDEVQIQTFLREIFGDSSPEELQRKSQLLLEIIRDLYTVIVETFTFTSVSQWKIDLRAARTALVNVQDDMKAIQDHLEATPVQQLDDTFLPLMSTLYFSQRDALASISAAVLSNKKIWNKFLLTTGFCGIMTGMTGVGGYTVAQEIYRLRSARAVACSSTKLSVASVGVPVVMAVMTGLSIYSAWDSISTCWMNLSWCGKIDECFRTCERTISDSHRLTGYLYLLQDTGREGQYISNDAMNQEMQKFIQGVIEVTQRDPRLDPEGFVAEGFYKRYIMKQRSLLGEVLLKHKDSFDKTAGEMLTENAIESQLLP